MLSIRQAQPCAHIGSRESTGRIGSNCKGKSRKAKRAEEKDGRLIRRMGLFYSCRKRVGVDNVPDLVCGVTHQWATGRKMIIQPIGRERFSDNHFIDKSEGRSGVKFLDEHGFMNRQNRQ